MKILIRPEELSFTVEMKCFLHLCVKQPYVVLKNVWGKQSDRDTEIAPRAPLLLVCHANKSKEV